MPEIIGHNYIGGARSAAGHITLHSHDATSGEALPCTFTQATRGVGSRSTRVYAPG
nr:hypothetical protein [Pseudomonas sp. FW300-N1A1]